MNPPTVLSIVVSCLLAVFIHSALPAKVLENSKAIPEARTAAQSSHQLSPFLAATSGTSLSYEESAADLNKLAGDRPRPTRETSSLPPQRTFARVNPAAPPASLEPVAGPSSAVPKKKFKILPRSYTRPFDRPLDLPRIPQNSYQQVPGAFSAKFANKQLRYMTPFDERTIGFQPYDELRHEHLIEAHKEIKVLSDFYDRIQSPTSPLQKAEIFEAAVNTLKSLPVEKLTQSGYEAWLQTFAAIMKAGAPHYVPNLRMEATAQHGLRDLATKFGKGVSYDTNLYFLSTEKLQQFLASRFSRIKDNPGLEAEAQSIAWASAVLYPDRPINFDSDLARYEEWLTADKTLAISRTLEKLGSTPPDGRDDQKTLLDNLKLQADMSSTQTSSKEKTAATIVLCMLGCAPGKIERILGRTSKDLQQQARQAMKELVPNVGIGLRPYIREVRVFPNNEQTIRQFQKTYYYGAMHDQGNFQAVTLFRHGAYSGHLFNQMAYDVLVEAMESIPKLDRYVRYVFRNPARPKSEAIKRYMDELWNTATERIEVEKFEMYIQAFAHTMAVDQKDPLHLQTEANAQFGLLNLMAKFSVEQDKTGRNLMESARGLQAFLSERLRRFGSIQLVNQAGDTAWATEVLFPHLTNDLKSDVSSHSGWFEQDDTIKDIFLKLQSPLTGTQEGEGLVFQLKFMATIQAPGTAQLKTASLMLLIHLGYADRLKSRLQATARSIQGAAVTAINELAQEADNLLLPNNATRVRSIPRLIT